MDREAVLADHTLLVRDGKIVALGPADTLTVPEDARRIDGRGRFLMPGLADMRGHVPETLALADVLPARGRGPRAHAAGRRPARVLVPGRGAAGRAMFTCPYDKLP